MAVIFPNLRYRIETTQTSVVPLGSAVFLESIVALSRSATGIGLALDWRVPSSNETSNILACDVRKRALRGTRPVLATRIVSGRIQAALLTDVVRRRGRRIRFGRLSARNCVPQSSI